MGLGPFRSPLLRTSRLISLPPGTEMFQFPGFASRSRVMTGLATRRVAPFGHLGITACVPLPRASRSLPRPSSPPCAQASPTCLPSLDYKNRSSRAYAHCFLTSDVFLRKSLSKDSSIPRSTIHPLSNSDDPHGASQGVNNREWNGQNVSRRSDYVNLSTGRSLLTRIR